VSLFLSPRLVVSKLRFHSFPLNFFPCRSPSTVDLLFFFSPTVNSLFPLTIQSSPLSSYFLSFLRLENGPLCKLSVFTVSFLPAPCLFTCLRTFWVLLFFLYSFARPGLLSGCPCPLFFVSDLQTLFISPPADPPNFW